MSTPWQADVLTLYPEAFPGTLGVGVIGRALEQELWSLRVHALREFGQGPHKSVDDSPAGGGPGMVMRVDILAAAIDALAKDDERPVIIASPRGKPMDQALARELSSGPGVIAIAPRFEGFDERILARRTLVPISLGDAVYAGGEVAIMAVLEACTRLLPGVLGDAASASDESFEHGLLEYAHYTRPVTFEGEAIPEVLRSGNHQAIDAWRQAEREEATRRFRPDLWHKHKPLKE